MASSVTELKPKLLPDEELFVLKKYVTAHGIKLAARTEIGRQQLTAFVGRNSDVSLHFLSGESNGRPVMKLIPWFSDPNKRITAMCFDPSGSWLLLAGYDNSLFILPALALVDAPMVPDHRWSSEDVTIFPPIAGAQSSSAHSAHPVAVAWWQSVLDCQHTAVVGNDRGDIAFISLASGAQLGLTYVKSPIASLHLCQDNSLDMLFLLISDQGRDQWKLVLEQRTTRYSWPLEQAGATSRGTSSDLSSSSHSSGDTLALAEPRGQCPDLELGSRAVPTARSRLQGLKQLSVEKLASLRQRLAETRSRTGVMSVGTTAAKRAAMTGLAAARRELESGVAGGGSSSGGSSDEALGATGTQTSAGCPYTSSGPRPERLSAHVGDTFLQPQHARGQHLMSGYYTPGSVLTIHGMSLEIVPLFVYKLPPNCSEILVTDRFLFVTNKSRNEISIVSAHLSESRLDGDSDFNPDSVISSFSLEGEGEEVVALFRRAESSCPLEELSHKTEGRPPAEGSHSSQPREFRPGKLEPVPVDTCVAVTTHGMYGVCLRRPAPAVFLELVLQHQELERAERLALVFGLNLQELLEHAGDLRLSARDFPNAVSLYKLSRCRHLKSVLKFAAGGFSCVLLSYINLLFSSPGLDLTAAERIHLSNLAVMSNTEQVLRNAASHDKLFKSFLRFLQDNMYYDEVLAVNVAGQTGLWEVLSFLTTARGLYPEVLDVLSKVMRSSNESKLPEGPADILSPTREAGLWQCLSEPALQQWLLVRPQQARQHLTFVEAHLGLAELPALQRLAALYDPSAPAAACVLSALLRSPHKHCRCPSDCSPSDLLDPNVNEDALFPAQLLVQTFLLVLVMLAQRRAAPALPQYDSQLVQRVPPPPDLMQGQGCGGDVEAPPTVPLQDNVMSTGFSHMAVVRNGTVYTWGCTLLGCLGAGPTMSRYSIPQPVSLLGSLPLEVLAVACGRQHTLALTSAGVYAWGSSQFGQLGVGKTGQSPCPRLVEALAQERVAVLVAGQYHSIAVTQDGRALTWGWGVHGQLGHKSVEDEHLPRLVERLADKVVVQASAGHGHSLLLDSEGTVYACGSNVFGQLGNGTCVKSSAPAAVAALTEPIRLVATGYFHNLAVSRTNRLYTWGSSPQVLRLQAQAQKKARIMQQQVARTSASPHSPGSPNLSPGVPQSQSHPAPPASLPSTPTPVPGSPATATAASKDAKVLRASLTLENLPNSSHSLQKRARSDHSAVVLSEPSGKVSTTPEVMFDEDFPESSKEVGVDLDLKSAYSTDVPAIVVSPTVEFKGLSPPPLATNSDSLDGEPGLGNKVPRWQGDESQAHLFPQLVDTALVNGHISQISCGCHHSALLSSDGTLYMWGRNLDGQVGNGSRKEVPLPTPLQWGPQGGGAGVERAWTGLQQVSCGCEFTAAVEASSGRLWAWGTNSHAQLGFTPVEDGKPLEGKLVMLKTTKRVIKLPHGMHNSCDLPREVAGLPTPSISFPGSATNCQGRSGSGSAPGSRSSAANSCCCPPLARLEQPGYGLHTLHFALQQFHGHYDSQLLLARCLEMENFQAAARLSALDRRYHQALAYQLQALALSSSVGSPGERCRNHRNRSFPSSRAASTEIIGGDASDNAPDRDNLSNSRLEQDMVDKENRKNSLLRGGQGEGEGAEVQENRENSRMEDTEGRDKPQGAEHKRVSLEEARSPSASSNAESVTSLNPAEEGEMHAFSIQGGREQMSEGSRPMVTPDSSPSHAPTPPEGRAEPCEEAAPGPAAAPRAPVSPAAEQRAPAAGSPRQEALGDSSQRLVEEAAAIVEHYVCLMEEDSHSMLGQLLQQGLEFWTSHALPMDTLESLLLRHMPKFCYPLGLLLFRGSAGSKQEGGCQPEATLLSQLSTRFCLQLCTTLLGHLSQRKSSPEYVELLAQTATATSLPGSTPNGSVGILPGAAADAHLNAALRALRALRSPGDSSGHAYISLSHEEVLQCGLSGAEPLLVFSCGHQCGANGLDSGLQGTVSPQTPALPATARVLASLLGSSSPGPGPGPGPSPSPSLPMACPRCVLGHLQARIPA